MKHGWEGARGRGGPRGRCPASRDRSPWWGQARGAQWCRGARRERTRLCRSVRFGSLDRLCGLSCAEGPSQPVPRALRSAAGGGGSATPPPRPAPESGTTRGDSEALSTAEKYGFVQSGLPGRALRGAGSERGSGSGANAGAGGGGFPGPGPAGGCGAA